MITDPNFLAVGNLVAAVISPILAVVISIWISMWVQDRKELKRRRFEIFLELISSRHHIITDAQAKAFNSIDVVFASDHQVRKLWREYFELLLDSNQQHRWNTKRLELMKAIADVVGYKDKLDHLDLDRIYAPRGISEALSHQDELSKEWLRVLKGSKSFASEKTNV